MKYSIDTTDALALFMNHSLSGKNADLTDDGDLTITDASLLADDTNTVVCDYTIYGTICPGEADPSFTPEFAFPAEWLDDSWQMTYQGRFDYQTEHEETEDIKTELLERIQQEPTIIEFRIELASINAMLDARGNDEENES